MRSAEHMLGLSKHGRRRITLRLARYVTAGPFFYGWWAYVPFASIRLADYDKLGALCYNCRVMLWLAGLFCDCLYTVGGLR